MTNPIKDKGEMKLIPLPVPIVKTIKNVEVTIKEVELSKPHAGHLRGVNIFDVAQGDFEAGTQVIPRISELDERDMQNLDPANWMPLLVGLASFFGNTGS
ncbi:phage tail assembly protein [Vibrio sp. 10N.222.54.F12]|uniref:phage tail assembly protein n=1 Tax=Vibrio sp. 10N.222.54.F12 TaxID=3229644 RepID=UPI00354D654A